MSRFSTDDIGIGAVERTRVWFYLAMAVWAGSRVLDLSDTASRLITVIAVVALILQIAAWANHGVSLWLERTRRERAESDPGAVTTLTGLSEVLSADYAVYMDVQQSINLEIVRHFAERDIEIAYPTRTLHMATPVTTEVLKTREESGRGRG